LSITKNLINWYQLHKRNLPWRQTQNPYFILISEVMLQQTQVTKVLNYYQPFIQQFPDVFALANAKVEQVLKIWEGLGYYARARNLHAAAQMIVKNMAGEFPTAYSQLKSLPGIGEYIAAAVLSIAYDQPLAVVDGNVKRVLARAYRIDKPINKSSSFYTFQEIAQQLLDQNQPGHFNQAIMELGALICRPVNPYCDQCPIKAFCKANNTDQVHLFPVKLKKNRIPEYHLVAGIVYKGNQFLIVRRKIDGFLGGMWEIPGGRIQGDELPEQTCIRFIRENVNITAEIVEYLAQIRHAYSHFKIKMDIFRCHYLEGEEILNGYIDSRWITKNEVTQYPFHLANHKVFKLLG